MQEKMHEQPTGAANIGTAPCSLPLRAADAAHMEAGDLEAPALADRRTADDIGRAPNRYRARILVLGAGYAGLTCFLELQEHLDRHYDVVLINGDRYHWFTTELHTYVAGEAEDAVRISLSRVVAKPGRLVVGRVEAVHVESKAVELASGERIPYDYLVFALGSDPEYYGLPGVAENSLIVGNWHSASALRLRIREIIEGDGKADTRPRVVVAGGGLTGVEVVAELADEYPGRLVLTILEAGPEIMAGFAAPLVERAREVLLSKGIEIKTGNPITKVEREQIIFKDGSMMGFDVLVWAGGVRGSGILAKSGLPVTQKGRAKVDAFLRVEGHEDIYVVGDSASFTDPATGREVPPTGQAAVQMGRAAGRNLLRVLRGQAPVAFEPHLKGAFASLGRTEGVGQIGKEHFIGLPAMVVKNLIEARHAWETGGGVMPLVNRLLRGSYRIMRGMPTKRHFRSHRVPPPPANAGGQHSQVH